MRSAILINKHVFPPSYKLTDIFIELESYNWNMYGERFVKL